MTAIIRALNQCSTEQEQRQLQRSIARLERAGRQQAIPTPIAPLVPRPQFPAGIVPVFVVNPMIETRRSR